MNDRWKNRRRMAWLAMLAGLIYPLIPMSEQMAAVLTAPFYFFVGSIVGSYVGFSTVDDKWQRNEDE